MIQGIVHTYEVARPENHKEIDFTVLVVSYRDCDQLLPGGSAGFLNQEEMEEAIRVVAEKLGWKMPSLNGRNIFKDVSSGLGWSFHPSNPHKDIPLGEGKILQVYRRGIDWAGEYLA